LNWLRVSCAKPPREIMRSEVSCRVSIVNSESPRYRIKSAMETYERVVPESDLKLSTTCPCKS
jgi:hypothetical protein